MKEKIRSIKEKKKGSRRRIKEPGIRIVPWRMNKKGDGGKTLKEEVGRKEQTRRVKT